MGGWFPRSPASVGGGQRSASEGPVIPWGQCLVGTQVLGGPRLDALETLPVASSVQGRQRCVLRSPPPNAVLPLVGAMAPCRHGPAICDNVPRRGRRGPFSTPSGGGGGCTRELTHVEVWAPNMYPAEAEPLPPAAFHPPVWPEDLLDHPPPGRGPVAGGGGGGLPGSRKSQVPPPLATSLCPAPPGPRGELGFVTVDSSDGSGSDEGGKRSV